MELSHLYWHRGVLKTSPKLAENESPLTQNKSPQLQDKSPLGHKKSLLIRDKGQLDETRRIRTRTLQPQKTAVLEVR